MIVQIVKFHNLALFTIITISYGLLEFACMLKNEIKL